MANKGDETATMASAFDWLLPQVVRQSTHYERLMDHILKELSVTACHIILHS